VPPRAADITALLRALVAHEVEFVVVGGVCAVLHGAPLATFDLDIVPARTEGNIERLIRALQALEAVHRDLAGRSIPPDAKRLLGPGHHLLMTRAGPIDVLGEIGAHRDYTTLSPRSRMVDLGEGLMVRVLDLDALIDTKKEAARAKDLAALPVLERTLEESRRRGG
jgi:hypothetical protein